MKQRCRRCPAGSVLYLTSALNLPGTARGLFPNFHHQTTPLHFPRFGPQELRASIYADLYSRTVYDVKILETTQMSINRATVEMEALGEARLRDVLLNEKN